MALEKTIKIKVDSGGAKASVDNLDGSVNKLDRSAKNTTDSFNKFKVAAAALAAAAIAIGVGVARTVAKFQSYEASLKTATGSTENAAIAMKSLQDFAASTPFALEQSIEAFTKLRNFGLDPSEKALRSYGNTAVALGKDLNQMIEAVADAATGEFERLKEFGIKSKTEGDKVAFSFQGNTTRVGKNAAEITAFLQSIGEENFAGAMEDQFNSLNGSMSNFGDNIDRIAVNIGNSGFTDILTEGFALANMSLSEFSDAMESGQLSARLDAFTMKFDDIAREVTFVLDFIAKEFNDVFSLIPINAEASTDLIVSAFSDMPQNISAFIKIMVTEVLAGFDRVAIEAAFLKDSLAAVFTDDTIDDAALRRVKSIEMLNDVRESSIQSIMDEREAAISSVDKQIVKSNDLRKTFDELKAARLESSKGEGGNLGQFAIVADVVEDDSKPFANTEKIKTESLRAELNERLAANRAFAELLLSQNQGFAEEQRALIAYDEALALEAVIRKQADSDAGFIAKRESLLMNRQLDAEALAELESELKEQELLELELFELEKTNIEEDAAARRADLIKQEADVKRQILTSSMNAVANILSVGGEKAAKIGKKIAIVSAVIKGKEAAVAAWNAGMSTGGPWAPLVAAAYAGASIVQTGSIISSMGGGGGSTPSIGGGANSTSQIPQQQPQRQELPQQQNTIEIRGLSEIATALADYDPTTLLPVEHMQRLTASFDEYNRLSGGGG